MKGIRDARIREGLAFRDRRKGLGLSQYELAAILGIHETTVSRWERGISRIEDHAWKYLRSGSRDG